MLQADKAIAELAKKSEQESKHQTAVADLQSKIQSLESAHTAEQAVHLVVIKDLENRKSEAMSKAAEQQASLQDEITALKSRLAAELCQYQTQQGGKDKELAIVKAEVSRQATELAGIREVSVNNSSPTVCGCRCYEGKNSAAIEMLIAELLMAA